MRTVSLICLCGGHAPRWVSGLQGKAKTTKDDLMNRLNNAIKQRDAAREESLSTGDKLAKLQEEIDSGALVPAAQVCACSL